MCSNNKRKPCLNVQTRSMTNKKPSKLYQDIAKTKTKIKRIKKLSDIHNNLKKKPIKKPKTLSEIIKSLKPKPNPTAQTKPISPVVPVQPTLYIPKEPDLTDDHVSFLFSSDADVITSTLTGLLWSSDTPNSDDDPLSPSLNYAYPPPDRFHSSPGSFDSYLVHGSPGSYRVHERNALRKSKEENHDEEEEEERWVTVVVPAEVKEEEVTSCSYRDYWSYSGPGCSEEMSVGLKLDYQCIMDAWDGEKGSVYVDGGDGSRVVPNILDQHNVLGDISCVMGMVVPQLRVQPDGDGEYPRMTKEEKEAKVLRYKKKRHNRLFEKKIRYEVRRVNAEKRPRMKGRFIKRD